MRRVAQATFVAFAGVSLLNAQAQQDSERTLSFHQSYTEETLRVDGESCEPYLDDPSNYEVDPLGSGRFKVRARRLSEASAILLIDCGAQQYVFALSYRNEDLNAARSSGSLGRYARSSSSYGTQVRYAPGDGANLNVALSDSSWDGLQVFATESYTLRPGGGDFQSTSLDFMHLGDRSALSYGLTQEFRGDSRLINVRASSTISRFTLIGNRQYRDGDPQNERYSVYLPDPIRMRYSHSKDRVADESSDAIARDFYLNERAWRNNATLQFTNGRRSLSKYNTVSWYNAFEYDVARDLSHLINTEFTCGDQIPCRVAQLGNALTYRARGTEVTGTYSLLPHLIGLSTNVELAQDSRLFAVLSKKLDPLGILKKSSLFGPDGKGTGADATSNARFGAGWGDFSGAVTIGQSQMLSTPTSTAGFEAAFDQREYRIDGGYLYATSDSAPTRWEARLGYRRFFEPGLVSLALQLDVHKLSGFVRSNFERKPIPNALVTLKEDGGQERTVSTDQDGFYSFSDVAGTGDFTVSVLLKRSIADVTSVVSFRKALSTLDVKQDIQVNDHAVVPVRFFLDAGRTGNFDAGNVRVDLENYNEMVEGGVVTVDGGRYVASGIILARGCSYQAVVTPEFLPMGYSFDKASGTTFDLKNDEPEPIRILLKRTD